MIKQSQPFVNEDIKQAILNVLDSKIFVKGKCIETFEKEFAKFVGVDYGISVNSGTSALFLALKALGIKKGDEVIVPSHTFVASATPILMCGATPIFVDVSDDYLIDISDIETKITENTKAIIAVHLYGQPCNMEKLRSIMKILGIYLIEDACQAHGAKYNGKNVGTFGDVSVFSFFPSKNMTVCGDGGISVTNNKDLARKMKMQRDHGRDYTTENGKYNSSILGYNFRLSEIPAATGIEQLKHITEFNSERNEIAYAYNKYLTSKIIKPISHFDRYHVYHQYVIRTDKRNELKQYLYENGIETGIHYPIPCHKQDVFAYKNIKTYNLENTEKICDEILSLPMYPSLKPEEVNKVILTINKFFGE